MPRCATRLGRASISVSALTDSRLLCPSASASTPAVATADSSAIPSASNIRWGKCHTERLSRFASSGGTIDAGNRLLTFGDSMCNG